MRPPISNLLAAVTCLCFWVNFPARLHAADEESASIEKTVAQAVGPVMERLGIPGMAIGVVVDGRSHVFFYGVSSRATGRPVESGTLFEIGSVSKTFTATLTAYAQIEGVLALSDPVSKYLPALRDHPFGQTTLLQLGTHTAGRLPLQMPDEVTNEDGLFRYLQAWKPTADPGVYRTYSNLGIGLLGVATARSMRADFRALMEGRLFPAFGLKNTYLEVPAVRADSYAQGYTERDVPIRMKPGVLGAEAYGVRTTAGDLLRFVDGNLGLLALGEKWQRAVTSTHTGYWQVGPMTQDLIWEQYPQTVTLPDLLAGNSSDMILESQPATVLDPPLPPREDVLIDKTGSTNGFSTYVAFVPARRIGVVLLANKRFPIDARVTLAYEILSRLADHGK